MSALGRAWPVAAARGYILLLLGFMFLPAAVLVVFAFQSGNLPIPPFNGPSLRWFLRVAGSSPMMAALANSLLVGAAATVTATGLGFCCAYAVARHAGRLRILIDMIMLVPASISYLVVGMGLQTFFHRIGLPPSLLAVGIGHAVVTLPIAFSVISSQMDPALARVEMAAQDLGAAEWQSILLVTLPMLKAPLATAFFLAFSLSWDEFIIAFMLSRFDVTMPVEIWTSMRSGLNPFINAAGTLVFGISLIAFLALTAVNLRRAKPA